ncbi:MAG: hypothetical protein CMJ89_13285 [Planctomycetes bacterium]|nr:hypothetical protein [Planctomycetota bacterium]
MTVSPLFSLRRITALTAIFLLQAPPASQTPGEVLSFQKISEATGGFTGLLGQDDGFGRSVARIGDVDGDGIQDLGVGAIFRLPNNAISGAVWILFMNADGSARSQVRISQLAGTQAGDLFGNSISALGDLNGDGIPDIVVGAPNDDDGGINRGAIYIMFLQRDGTVLSSKKFSSRSGSFTGTLDNHDNFGIAVQHMGDLDGDGNAEVVVGATGDDDGGANRGALWVLSIDSNAALAGSMKISSTAGGFGAALVDQDRFGGALTNLGDLNSDGRPDLAVGVPQSGVDNKGAVYVLFLQSDATVLSELVIGEGLNGFTGGLANEDRFGSALASLGDLDGDGFSDIAIGSRDNDGGADRGSIWILFLASTGDVRGFQKISNSEGGFGGTLDNGDMFGSSLSFLGDLNGNTGVELAVGARNDDDGDAPNQGAIYVITIQDGPAAPPVAHLTATPTSGPAPLRVNFFDQTTGNAHLWSWDFGDGGVSTQQNPSHVYSIPGTYSVGLTATGVGGVDNDTQLELVVVGLPVTIANFTAAPTSGATPLTVNFTDMSTGGVTSWIWSFGDGSTSTLQNPSHTYFTEGAFDITLTTDGPNGQDTLTRPDHVVSGNSVPTAAFIAVPTTGPAPLFVNFTNQTTGTTTGHLWRFGDNTTSDIRDPGHVYTNPGTYTVQLTATGPGGDNTLVVTDLIVVDPPLTQANFETNPTSGESPLTVTFTDRSSGGPTSWSWDFGDGSTSTSQNPTHIYTALGTYTVSLMSEGPAGSHTLVRPDLIVVHVSGPTAAFTSDVIGGPAPLTVNFTDSSIGNVTSYIWRFGDGDGSVLADPQHTYLTAGTYSVVLTVDGPDGENTLSVTNMIVVDPAGTHAAFDVSPTRGELPLVVSFTDRSGGNPTSWSWDFGDGSTSTTQSPTHTYTTVGTYTVALTTDGPTGPDTRIRSDLIVVNPVGPTAAFTSDVTNGVAPLIVAFSDLSTGNITSYSWHFGDGIGSGQQNPVHTYPQAGTYSVILSVNGPEGEDSLSQVGMIVVNPAGTQAAFDALPTRGEVPLIVSFMDRSSGGATSWNWDFGDGSTSTLQNPTHSFSAVGTYTISLTADGTSGTDTRVRTDLIVVNPVGPTSAFTPDVTSGVVPLTVAFTDLSTGNITSWIWRFGDGDGSALQNPVHTYMLQGTYSVILTISGPDGTDALSQGSLIVVDPPGLGAAFDAAPTRGEVPLLVSFSDRSTGGVTSFVWDFGDGATSTAQNPTHTYTNVGTYTVSLAVDGASGQDTRVRTDLVVVNPVGPTAAFVTDPPGGPAPLTVNFTDISTGSVTGWSWRFGDGELSGDQHPIHTYTQQGTYGVVLTVNGPDGDDSISLAGSIVVDPPGAVAAFDATPTRGEVPLAVTFSDRSGGGPTSFNWDFGDGTTTTLQNPTHTYVAVGTYTVSLATDGPSGQDTRTRTDLIVVNPMGPTADFSANPIDGPAPLTVAFTDLSTGNVTTYSWRFGDGAGSGMQSPNHAYTTPGTYDVTLTVTGPDGTDLMAQLGLIVVSPELTRAAFGATPRTGEMPLNVSFVDQSTGGVTNWSWDFGDGSTSTLQSPLHVYGTTGTYTVTLTSTGPQGTDTLVQTDFVVVNPSGPNASFTASPVTGEPPLVVAFTDQSTGNVTSWSWYFGDATTSSIQNPNHAYTDMGTYSVSLTVTGPEGMNTLIQSDLIIVDLPVTRAEFDAIPLDGEAPLTVTFTDRSRGTPNTFAWDFGDGSSATTRNPSHTYDTPGTYTVSLTATGPNGSDTLVKNNLIEVRPPVTRAAFAGQPLAGNAPLTVNFIDQSLGSPTSWTWDFGDGQSSTLQDPSHAYASQGFYTVSLTADGPNGTDTTSVVDMVAVGPIVTRANFTATPRFGNIPVRVHFRNFSSGDPTDYVWDLGDGSTSTLFEPTHIYQSAGTFSISLTAVGPHGTDTLVKPNLITLTEVPVIADFSASPTDGFTPLIVTFNDLSSGGATSWSWDFGDGVTSTLQNPTHTYVTDGLFTVSMTADRAGRVDTFTQIDLIDVQLGAIPPSADFTGSPTTGPAPLTVVFADTSTGDVSTWAWDFGDGHGATTQDTSHTYIDPGSYTVTLTTDGPAGTDTRTLLGFVTAELTPEILDGSFEGQFPGQLPGAPWIVTAGTGHVVHPTSLLGADNGMPSGGEQWAEISGDGSAAGTPPSNPGGEGTAPTATVGIRQDFALNLATPYLAFTAAFISVEPAGQTTTNDFMSVDITDGMTTYNLYYADSFSDFPLLSAVHGLPMTELALARADLRALFPTLADGSMLTLTIGVGNGGDGANSSFGYVDQVLLAQVAQAVVRNGTGVNVESYSATPPILDTTWTGTINTAHHPGATLVLIYGFQRGLTGPVLSIGELLMDVASPPLFNAGAPVVSDLATVNIFIVPNLAFIGLGGTTQAVILGGGSIELCNAVDVLVGF